MQEETDIQEVPIKSPGVRIALRITAWVFFSLLFLTFALVLALLSPPVQKAIAQYAAKIASETFKTEVRVGNFMFNTQGEVAFDQILIRDQQQDTLLYITRFSFNIREIGLNNRKFVLRNTQFFRPYLNLYQAEGDSTFNYYFIEKALALDQPDTLQKPTRFDWIITLRSFRFDQGRIHYQKKGQPYLSGIFSPNHVRLNQLSFSAKDFYFRQDSIHVILNNLKFKERSGFRIDSCATHFSMNDKSILLDSILLKTPYTHFNGSVRLKVKAVADWDRFNDKVQLNAQLRPSSLGASDLHFFSPEAAQVKGFIGLAGNFRGTVSRLIAKDLHLSFGRESYLAGHAKLEGLPTIKNTYIRFQMDNLMVKVNDIQSTLPLVKLPEEVISLGFLGAKGWFEGYPNKFKTQANLVSGLGNLNGDLSMDLSSEETSLVGEVQTNGFDLGRLLRTEDVKNIAFNGKLNARGKSFKTAVANLNVAIQRIDLSGYTYRDMQVNGNLEDKLFIGKINAKDPNGRFQFDGTVDLRDSLPFFNFTSDIQYLNLHKLGFSGKDTIELSGGLQLNLRGIKLDDLSGTLYGKQLDVKRNGYPLYQDEVVLRAWREAGKKNISLSSDYLDLSIEGDYTLSSLKSSIQRLIGKQIKESAIGVVNTNNRQELKLYGRVKQLGELAHFAGEKQLEASDLVLTGEYNQDQAQLDFLLTAQQFKRGNLRLDSLIIHGFSQPDTLKLTLESGRMLLNDSLVLDTLMASARLHHDTIYLSSYLTGKNSNDYFNIHALLDLDQEKTIVFQPSQFQLNSHRWTITQDGRIALLPEGTLVNSLSLNQANQRILLNGMISEEKADSFMVDLAEIDLQQLNPLLASAGTSLEGFLNSHLVINSVLKKPIISGNLGIEELVLDGEPLGDLGVNSFWNTRTERVELNASMIRESDTVAVFKGFVGTAAERQDLDIDISLNRSTVKPLEKILKPEFTELSGYATSKLHLYNTLDNPLLEGYVDLENARIRVDYLNTFYNASSRILFTNKDIDFNNMAIRDDKGGKATLSGKILHDYFRNTRIALNIEAENVQVLNTEMSPGTRYFGQGYVSGNARFNGHISQIDIDINAKTEKGTAITLPFGEAELSGDDNFIVFLSKDTTKPDIEKEKVELSGLAVKLDLKVTPDAMVNLVLDPIGGDAIKGKGVADLKMEYTRLGDFRMYGQYAFTQGDYLFTFQNLVNKNFKIQEGSRITWTGDPLHAAIDVKAIYNTRSYVNNLLSSESMAGVRIDSSQFSRRFSVDTYLKLTGDLLKPDIGTEIKIPGINENDLSNPVAVQLRNINNNEQELNRQIFGLLIMGSFLSEQSLQTQGVGAGLNTASELLSTQLSNWISKYAGNVNVGVNYREQSTAANNAARRELQVALNTTLFDNRVIIDGSLDVGNEQIRRSNQAVGGDFQIEYKVTEDGRFRVKAFNKIDDRVFVNKDSNYRQGVGISLRRDFEKPEDILAGPANIVKEYWKNVKEWLGLKKSTQTDGTGTPPTPTNPSANVTNPAP